MTPDPRAEAALAQAAVPLVWIHRVLCAGPCGRMVLADQLVDLPAGYFCPRCVPQEAPTPDGRDTAT